MASIDQNQPWLVLYKLYTVWICTGYVPVTEAFKKSLIKCRHWHHVAWMCRHIFIYKSDNNIKTGNGRVALLWTWLKGLLWPSGQECFLHITRSLNTVLGMWKASLLSKIHWFPPYAQVPSSLSLYGLISVTYSFFGSKDQIEKLSSLSFQLDLRRKQFHVLITSIHELQRILEGMFMV